MSQEINYFLNKDWIWINQLAKYLQFNYLFDFVTENRLANKKINYGR